MEKKKLNWTEVEARYIAGEPPRVIAEDFEDLTAKQISEKANRESWKQEKLKEAKKIRDLVSKDLEELCTATVRLHKTFITQLEGQIQDIQNPYLFDGERTNSLFQTAMNNSVKIFQSAMKVDDELPDEEEPAGFNITIAPK